jgi:heme/copper-type cytochrome/quinol oxidase subunit 2
MYIGGLMRTFAMFTPIIAALLLLTGIGNIHNRLLDAPYSWYDEHWLVAKIILFVILAINGAVVGRKLAMGRMMLIKSIADKNPAADAEQRIAGYNRKISLLFLVQTILIIAILYLATFGSGKHPGEF